MNIFRFKTGTNPLTAHRQGAARDTQTISLGDKTVQQKNPRKFARHIQNQPPGKPVAVNFQQLENP